MALPSYTPKVGNTVLPFNYNDKSTEAESKLRYLQNAKYNSAVMQNSPYNYDTFEKYVQDTTSYILGSYGEAGSDARVNSVYRNGADTAMAITLGIPVKDVIANRDAYRAIFTGGENLDDRSFVEAFAKSWEAENNNRYISSLQNRLDRTDDEDEIRDLEKEIEKAELYAIRLNDYTDRGWLQNNVIKSAPILRQGLRTLAITYGTGLALSGLASLASGAGFAESAMQNFTWANTLLGKVDDFAKINQYSTFWNGALGKGIMNTGVKAVAGIANPFRLGATLGTAIDMVANVYTTESGALSREIYKLEDKDGNHIDRETRVKMKRWGGALITIAEVMTPEPMLSRAYGGATFQQVMGDTFKAKTLDFIKKSLQGAHSESFEEFVQSIIGDVYVDLAKKHSKNGNFVLDEDRFANYMMNAVKSYAEAFFPSLLAGAVGVGTGSVASTIGEVAKYNNMGYKLGVKDISNIYMNNFMDASGIKMENEDIRSIIMEHQNINDGFSVRKTSIDFDGPRLSKETIQQMDEKYGDGNAPAVKVEYDYESNMYKPVNEENNKLAKYLILNKKMPAVNVSVVKSKNVFGNDAFSNLANMHNAVAVNKMNNTAQFSSQEDLQSFVESLGAESTENPDGTVTVRTENEEGKIEEFTLSVVGTNEESMEEEIPEPTARQTTEGGETVLEEDNDAPEADSDAPTLTLTRKDGTQLKVFRQNAVKEQIRNAQSQFSDEDVDALASYITLLPAETQNDIIDRINKNGGDFSKLFLGNGEFAQMFAGDEKMLKAGEKGRSFTLVKRAQIVLKDGTSTAQDVIHEIFHVLYNMFPEYRQRVIKALQNDLATNERKLRLFYEAHKDSMDTRGNSDSNGHTGIGKVESWNDFHRVLKSVTAEEAERQIADGYKGAPVIEELLARMSSVILMDPSNEAMEQLPVETKNVFQSIIAKMKEIYDNLKGKDSPESLEEAILSVYSNGYTKDGNTSERVAYSHEDETYMDAVKSGDVETARRMVEQRAKEMGFEDAVPEQTDSYSVRTKKAPTNVKRAYKTFFVDAQGRPSALFVNGTSALPMGVWMDAKEAWSFLADNGKRYVPSTANPNSEGGKTGTTVKIPNEAVRQELIKRGFIAEGSKATSVTALALRGGWHGGDLPFFPQGGRLGNRPDGKNAPYYNPNAPESNYANIHRWNQVVFEVEFNAEKDYTSTSVNAKGSTVFHDMENLPTDGYYKYSTNPMAKATDIGAWYISDSMKIVRALSEEECNEILANNGFKPQEWEGFEETEKGRVGLGKDNMAPMDLETLGYTGPTNDVARKTLAPITYDDNGEVIPLSERFNPEVNDIRYSNEEESNDAFVSEYRAFDPLGVKSNMIAPQDASNTTKYLLSGLDTTEAFLMMGEKTADRVSEAFEKDGISSANISEAERLENLADRYEARKASGEALRDELPKGKLDQVKARKIKLADAVRQLAQEKRRNAVTPAERTYNEIMSMGLGLRNVLDGESFDGWLKSVFKPYVMENYRFLLERASLEDAVKSALWYQRAHVFAEEIAEKFGLDIVNASYLIASLSPKKDWNTNLGVAFLIAELCTVRKDEVITIGKYKGQTVDMLNGNQVAEYIMEYLSENKLRCGVVDNIVGYDGDTALTPSTKIFMKKAVDFVRAGKTVNMDLINNVSTGVKVRSFANNILNPASAYGELTLDTHMVRSGFGLPFGGNEKISQNVDIGSVMSADNYQNYYINAYMQEAIRELADEFHVLPHMMQAIIWNQAQSFYGPLLKDSKNNIARAKENLENGNIEGQNGGIPRFLSEGTDGSTEAVGPRLEPDTFLELRGGGVESVRALLDRASDGRWRGTIRDEGRLVDLTSSAMEAQRLGEEARSRGLESELGIRYSNEEEDTPLFESDFEVDNDLDPDMDQYNSDFEIHEASKDYGSIFNKDNPNSILNRNIRSWDELNEEDVRQLIFGNVFIPAGVLKKFNNLAEVRKELQDRQTMLRLASTDERIAQLAMNCKTAGEFLTRLKKLLSPSKTKIVFDKFMGFKEVDALQEWGALYEKYFNYVHTASPSEMTSWFEETYASSTTTLEDLLELKSLLGLRKVNIGVKNGVRVYRMTADTSELYKTLSRLNKNSTKEDVASAVKKLKKNLATYVKEYAKVMVKAGNENALNENGFSPYQSSLMLLSLGTDNEDMFLTKLRASVASAEMDEATKDANANAKSIKWLKEGTVLEKLMNAFVKDAKEGLKDKSWDLNRVMRMANEYEQKLLREKGNSTKWEQRYGIALNEIRRLDQKQRELYRTIDRKERELQAERYKMWNMKESFKMKAIRLEKTLMYTEMFAKLDEKAIEAFYNEKISRIKAEHALRKAMRYNSQTHDAYYMDSVLKYLYRLIHNEDKTFNYIDCNDYFREADETGEQIDAQDVVMTTYDNWYEVDEEGSVKPKLVTTEVSFNPNHPRMDLSTMPEALERVLPKEMVDAIRSGELTFQSMTSEDINRIRSALATVKQLANLSKKAKHEVKMGRRRGHAMPIYESQFGSLDVKNMSREMKNKIIAKMDASGTYSNLRWTDEQIEDFIRRTPQALFSVLADDIKPELGKHLDAYKTMFMKMQRVAEWMDGKENGPIYNHFFRPLYEAYENKLAMVNKRRAEATEAFDMIMSDGDPKNRKLIAERKKLMAQESQFKTNSIDDTNLKTLNGWEQLGVYIYAQNVYGFVKLVSSAGNNINLEEIARINPVYAEKFIRYALGDRVNNLDNLKNEYRMNNRGQFTSTMGAEFKKDILNHVSTEELERVYTMLQKGEISRTSILPEFATRLGDKFIDLVGNRSDAIIKAGYDEYNMLTILQDRYFPLVALDSNLFKVKMDNGRARVNHGALLRRQMTDTYALNLDPMANFYSAIENQESIINMSPTINDMWWVMDKKGGNLKGIISQKFGNAWGKYFEEYLNMMANGNGGDVSDFARDVNHFIGNIAVSRIGLNLMTSVKQLVSLVPAMTKGQLTPIQVLSAMGKITNGTQKEAIKRMMETEAPSIYYSAYNVEAEKARQYDQTVGGDTFMANVREVTMKLTEVVDGFVKGAVWVAKYDAELAKGTSHKDAVFSATQLVQTTQSITDNPSLSQLQRNKNPLVRVAFMFTNDLFQTWNILTGDVTNAWKRGDKALALKEVFGTLLSSAILAFLAGGWIGDDDDDTPWYSEFMKDFGLEVSSYIPIAGPMVQEAFSGFNSSYYKGLEEAVAIKGMVSNQFKFWATDGEKGTDYKAGDWVDKGIEAIAEGGLSLVGGPATTTERMYKAIFPQGLVNGTTKSANSLWYLIGAKYGNAMYPND